MLIQLQKDLDPTVVFNGVKRRSDLKDRNDECNLFMPAALMKVLGRQERISQAQKRHWLICMPTMSRQLCFEEEQTEREVHMTCVRVSIKIGLFQTLGKAPKPMTNLVH